MNGIEGLLDHKLTLLQAQLQFLFVVVEEGCCQPNPVQDKNKQCRHDRHPSTEQNQPVTDANQANNGNSQPKQDFPGGLQKSSQADSHQPPRYNPPILPALIPNPQQWAAIEDGTNDLADRVCLHFHAVNPSGIDACDRP